MNVDIKMENEYIIYKVSFGQQVVSAAHALIIPAVVLFFTAGIWFQNLTFFISFISVFLVLYWIPILPIHFNYLKEDNGKIVKINYKQRIIVVCQYHQMIKVSFDDIQTIMINSRPPFGGYYYPFQNYKYARFNLKDNSYVIITRFIMNFDEELYGLIETTSKELWYPTIKEEGRKLI